jgi:Ca-activated chloride channel homolog
VPLELIVGVDVSGSMATAMPKLKSAVKELLNTVPARDQVTVMGFNDTAFSLTRPSTPPADRTKAIDRLAAWGATALYDVVLKSIEMAGRQVGRKAIIVFTDGEDEGSHAVLPDVEQRLQSSDAMLYMIGQGRGVTLEPLKRIMERLSKPTGGRALFTESIDELHDAFNNLLDELSQQYLLGYPPPHNVHDDTFRRLKVSVDGGYQVRARQGYRASIKK